jgi:hypothetical protein
MRFTLMILFSNAGTNPTIYVCFDSGMEARKGGDMAAAMLAAQAERAAVKAKREEKEKLAKK